MNINSAIALLVPLKSFILPIAILLLFYLFKISQVLTLQFPVLRFTIFINDAKQFSRTVFGFFNNFQNCVLFLTP